MVLVGGATAFDADLTAEMRAKLPVVVVVILGLSLLCLLLVFRSIAIPIKAVVMNLISTAAAIGLVVLVFQDGHGEHLLGFASPDFIQAYMPILIFALLFGISMDYEVFLVRRMQEEWRRTHDNRAAIVTGVEHTARPIVAAAAILVTIFGSFVTANFLEIKQLGFALAVAIAIDATLVRLVLVPAVMCMLGDRNWWFPARLTRALPFGGFADESPDSPQTRRTPEAWRSRKVDPLAGASSSPEEAALRDGALLGYEDEEGVSHPLF